VTNRERLRYLEERVCEAVCNVNGFVTRGESLELDRLRTLLRETYNPHTREWTEYVPEVP